MNRISGVGIDLEEVASFRRRKLTPHRTFYRRIFSNPEIAYCKRFRDPAPRFTVRFCAKEAFVKAARGVDDFRITDVEIRKRKSGAPYLAPRSKRAPVKKLFQSFEFILSLSHTDELACAIVLMGKRK